MAIYEINFRLNVEYEMKVGEIINVLEDKVLKTFPQAIELTVKKKHKRRTDAQMKYYWGVVLDTISQYTGFTRDELHIMFKARLLPTGRQLIGCPDPGRSTSELTTVEKSEYIEEIIRIAATEIGCYVPPPKDEEMLKWIEEEVEKGIK